MSILIKGMEMPTEGGTIVVYKINGQFFAARAGKNELFPLVPAADVVATAERREEIVEGDVAGGELLEIYDVSFPGISGAPAIQLKHNVERDIWGVWMPEKTDRDEIIRDALKKWEEAEP